MFKLLDHRLIILGIFMMLTRGSALAQRVGVSVEEMYLEAVEPLNREIYDLHLQIATLKQQIAALQQENAKLKEGTKP